MPDVTILIKPASGLCNMRCGYCFYYGAPGHCNGIMTHKTLTMLFKRIFEYVGDTACNVNLVWQGGEPTLAGYDYFADAVSLSKQYNTAGHHIYYSIQTNGLEVSDELAGLFSKEGFLVGISLDGTRETHDMNRRDTAGKGTYDRVMKTVKLFRRLGVEYNILCVISKATARNPAIVYRALTSAGFDNHNLQFIPCLDEGSVREAYSLDNNLLEKFLCTVFDCWYDDIINGKQISIRDFDNYVIRAAGMQTEICTMRGVCGCYFTVESNGSVYPCDFYVTPEWEMGNIQENSFSEMLACKTAIQFIEASKNHPEACRCCRYYSFCGSGCRRQRGADGTNLYCAAYRAFFDHAYDKIVYLSHNLIEK